MPKRNVDILAFNRGIVSTSALSRIDIDRIRWSAETQTNWMPQTLGPMSLRAGLEYIGQTDDNNKALHIPFVFSLDDTAIIELTNTIMRVRVDEDIITRPSVSSAVTNGSFTSDITGWTDNDESGAASTHSGTYMQLLGTGTNSAIREQQVTVSGGDQNTEHALRVVIERGPVVFKVGSTSGGDDYVSQTSLGTGEHSLAFTPTGNFYIEFSSALNRAVLVDSVAVEASGAMEITTIWSEANLELIRFDESADVIYLACAGKKQQKIERRGTRSWSVVDYSPDDGPFRSLNTSGVTIASSALTGNVTLTASKSLFNSNHVGALFKIISSGQNVSASISAQNTFSDSIRVIGVTDSRKFTIVRSGTWSATVTLQRSFDEGSSWEDVTTYTTNGSIVYDDGLDNQEVYYRIGVKTGDYTSGTVSLSLSYSLGSKTGIVRITAYSSATSVSAEVLTALGNTAATTDWAEGEWSDYRGWPSALALYEGRLWFAGKSKYWASVSDAYESFDDEIEGDSVSINKTIGAGPVDDVNWLLPLQRLILGAEGAEKSLRSTSFEEALTTTNINIKDASTRGSSSVSPIKIDKSGMFVLGPEVYEMIYDADAFDYTSRDITELTEIGLPYITRMAVQRRPDTRVHFVRSDGKVAILVYDPAENQRGFILFETDGEVEDVVVIKGQSTDAEDKVYYTVKRTINGSTVRYFEKWALESECIGGTTSKNLDSFYHYTGSSTAAISGLDHLEGETVYAWGNGKNLGSYTVSSGAITLSENVTAATIGLSYVAQYKNTKVGIATELGTPLNQRKRIGTIGFSLKNTHYQGLEYGPDFSNMNNLPLVQNGATTDSDTVWSELDTDMLPFLGGFSTDPRVCLKATAPNPVTVVSISYSVEINDKA